MTEPLILPDYSEVADALEYLGLSESAAGMHGQLCALLCTQPALTRKAWLDKVLSGVVPEASMEASLQVLFELFQATQSNVNNTEFESVLLLPEDDQPLHVRIVELSNWAQTFLTELKHTQWSERLAPADVAEALADLTKVACLDYDVNDEVSDEEEFAYTELVEFSRMTVELVRDHIQMVQASHGPIKISL